MQGGTKRSALLAVLLLAGLLGAALPAHAADDSNSGQLTPAPTLNAQQLNAALTSLSQGDNDTQLNQALSKFQSQIAAGNYSQAGSTLGELQGLSSLQGNSSQPLNALIQSLSVGSQGASVNASKLAGLISSGTGTTPQSQLKLSSQLQSLASLLQYANPTIASELLQNSSLLSQAALGNSVSLGSARVSLPGVAGFNRLGVPSMGVPPVSVGTPSGGLPAIPLAAFLVPVVVGAAVAVLYFSRRRIARLVGSQSLPGLTLLRGPKRESEEVSPPSDPRGRIEFYFGKAVRLMARRGVPKLEYETHREFSKKCGGAPERPHVEAISSLYEKAKFSGQEVAGRDADLAASEFLAMDRGEVR